MTSSLYQKYHPNDDEINENIKILKKTQYANFKSYNGSNVEFTTRSQKLLFTE